MDSWECKWVRCVCVAFNCGSMSPLVVSFSGTCDPNDVRTMVPIFDPFSHNIFQPSFLALVCDCFSIQKYEAGTHHKPNTSYQPTPLIQPTTPIPKISIFGALQIMRARAAEESYIIFDGSAVVYKKTEQPTTPNMTKDINEWTQKMYEKNERAKRKKEEKEMERVLTCCDGVAKKRKECECTMLREIKSKRGKWKDGEGFPKGVFGGRRGKA